MPGIDKQHRSSGDKEKIRQQFLRLAEGFKQMDRLDQAAIATAPIPLVGDVVGLTADLKTLYKNPSMFNAGMAAFGALPFVPSLGMVKAFHGTPHKVDKFSMDKIGTGEGAQVYGHGLYFAESPDVAKQYKDALSGNRFDANVFPDFNEVVPPEIGSVIRKFDGDLDAVERYFKDKLVNGKLGGIRNQASESLDWLNKNKEALNPQIKGNLYQVDLNVEPEDLLDWDAPITEQVLEKLKGNAGIDENLVVGNWRDYQSGDMVERMPTGAEVYGMLGGGKMAAEKLKSLGIPGIQYYDGMSRSAGKGTRNYVIFDDSLIGKPNPYK